ncbi:HD domain-containing phosphohydrolase [Enterovibrio sp. 27052020O]|uniref:HD domain-containing phosphohydrolase n=1 Tax=Enterovibrio sp. 27052020O TaxID=3241166 RepID=UPI00388FC15A
MIERRYTLQIHIAGIFFVVVSVLSVLLIVLSYQNSKALNQQLALERTEQNAEQIKQSFQRLVAPVTTSLDMLAVSNFGQEPSTANNRMWLATIDAIMQKNPDVLSIYLGYPDEQSAFVRSTTAPFMRQQFSTPQNSHIMVDVNKANGQQERTYYDANLGYIGGNVNKIDYLPTTRPWYKVAPSDGSIHITDPYFYFFIQRMGITLSRQLANNKGVIAADITLASLSNFLSSLTDSADAQLLLLDHNKNIIAHNGFLSHADAASPDQLLLSLARSPLNDLYAAPELKELTRNVEHTDQTWTLSLVHITFAGGKGLWLAKAIPEDQLIGSALNARNNQIAISALVLLLGTLMVLWASTQIAKPLKALGEETKKIRNLDFSNITLPTSAIAEVRTLSESIGVMADTISGFLDTLHRVSNSSNFNSLLNDIVSHCHHASGADFVLMWTRSTDDHTSLSLTARYPENASDKAINIAEILTESPEISSALECQQFFSFTPSSTDIQRGLFPADLKRVWLLPLNNRESESVGYVLLGFNHHIPEHQEEKIHFMTQFLGFASLIKENWDRVAAQKHLFKSFVELMASAIDTKSPYTGGHCQRVPELTFMLADAASKDTKHFADFTLDEQSQEALYFAAWLHDCGKVTTPEYVVDKATKLETIYNRIHEIRTRFEVLKRDAEISYWKRRSEGEDVTALDHWLRDEHKALDDDFAFIAKHNLGDEFMDSKNVTRLEEIASRTWYRTIDDMQGLSWEEEDRRQRRKDRTLPCKEHVLSNKLEHQIPWLSQQLDTFENWEFKLPVPDLQYNRGELHNLSIQRGTLTNEERFIINDHIIQTIKMLRRLPYPTHLERVPEIAGGHHEKLDGKGYPYGLDETNLSVDARIMAIADIFEALTASDRPYKKAKTLSEAMKILAFMAKDKHVDPKLFRLFIEQKIYLRYAEAFLPQSQQDTVDEQALLAMITPKEKTETAAVT